jgi:nucleobase transporter 1/2
VVGVVDEEADKGVLSSMRYLADDIPPFALSIAAGLQTFTLAFGATISIPLILSEPLGPNYGCVLNEATGEWMHGETTVCAGPPESADLVLVGKLISSLFFMSGWSTLVQTMFGNRLPVFQGGSFSFIPPMFAICADPTLATASPEEKLQVFQGAMVVGGIIEALVGFSGLTGYLMRFISPVSISVTVAHIGFSLYQATGFFASGDWGLSSVTFILVLCMSQADRLPFLRKAKESRIIQGLKMFPIVISLAIMWSVAAIITATGGFEETDPGYTSLDAVGRSDWIRWPYPLQWGPLRFEGFAIAAIIPGYVASMVESLGDYQACARITAAGTPNKRMYNTGIGFEGVASVFCGLVGTSSGTTTYSENISSLATTGVGSRFVVQVGAFFFLILGLFSKFGALFSSIPMPVVGGIWLLMFGMIGAVGLSALKDVDLRSTRNLTVIGVSFFLGLVLPEVMRTSPPPVPADPVAAAILNIIVTICSTGMAVALFTSLVLDNLLEGSDRERGLHVNNLTGDHSYMEYLREDVATCRVVKTGLHDLRACWPAPGESCNDFCFNTTHRQSLDEDEG